MELKIVSIVLLVAFGLGIVIFPWNITLQKTSVSNFFVVLGMVYILAGLLIVKIRGGNLQMSWDSFSWAFVTSLIYVVSIWGISYSVSAPNAKLTVISAITATYPLVTLVIELILNKKIPAISQILFIMLAVIAVIGLSLTKNT